ncbi:MAG TPA: hypothetical protein VFY34_06335 [Pyrinomonadaceae bacterium]|nr:hypothetical protein [Pyrinomonadaceae bacterium]
MGRRGKRFSDHTRLEYRTNDGGNIDYTNAISPNFVFDIRVSLNRFVQERRPAELFDPANGQLNLEGPVIVGGLGGNPYRDGSYEYYLSEKVITNDPKGVGALLLAATEIERRAARTTGKKRVS